MASQANYQVLHLPDYQTTYSNRNQHFVSLLLQELFENCLKQHETDSNDIFNKWLFVLTGGRNKRLFVPMVRAIKIKVPTTCLTSTLFDSLAVTPHGFGAAGVCWNPSRIANVFLGRPI